MNRKKIKPIWGLFAFYFVVFVLSLSKSTYFKSLRKKKVMKFFVEAWQTLCFHVRVPNVFFPLVHEHNTTPYVEKICWIQVVVFTADLLMPCCKIKVEPWSQPVKSFLRFALCPPSEWQPHSSLWHLCLFWCWQGPLVRSRLTSVNHSHVSTAADATATPAASLAPARPVSRDTGAKTTLTSARGNRAKMGVCVWMARMGKEPGLSDLN